MRKTSSSGNTRRDRVVQGVAPTPGRGRTASRSRPAPPCRAAAGIELGDDHLEQRRAGWRGSAPDASPSPSWLAQLVEGGAARRSHRRRSAAAPAASGRPPDRRRPRGAAGCPRPAAFSSVEAPAALGHADRPAPSAPRWPPCAAAPGRSACRPGHRSPRRTRARRHGVSLTGSLLASRGGRRTRTAWPTAPGRRSRPRPAS